MNVKHEPGSCPVCGLSPTEILSLNWLEELYALAERYHLIDLLADLASMALPERWQAYQWVLRCYGGQQPCPSAQAQADEAGPPEDGVVDVEKA